MDVGDKNVCEDCKRLNRCQTRTLNMWVSVGLPGSGHTLCLRKCRCILLPETLLEVFPTLRGQTIKLRDDVNLRIRKAIDYTLFTKLDGLVEKYETITDNLNLPASYYNLYDVNERIKFLENVIKQIESGKITGELWHQIKLQNPFLSRIETRGYEIS